MGTTFENIIHNLSRGDSKNNLESLLKELIYSHSEILKTQKIILERLESYPQVITKSKPQNTTIPNPQKTELANIAIEKWNAFCDCPSKRGVNYKKKNIKLALNNKKLIDNISARFKQDDFDYDLMIEIMKLHPHHMRASVGFDYIFESPNKWHKIVEGKFIDHGHAAQAEWKVIQQKMNQVEIPTEINNLFKGAFG